MAKKFRTRKDRTKSAVKIVSGVGNLAVLILTIASSFVAFYQVGLSIYSAIFVVVCFFLFVSLLGNLVFWIEQRSYKNNAKYIAFITPSCGDQPFYSAMLEGLVKNCALATGHNFVVIPAMPQISFESLTIWSLFTSMENRNLDIDGVVFIPDDPDAHFDEIVDFVEAEEGVPLVLVDVFFDLSKYDKHNIERLPSFVGGDEQHGGALAADIMYERCDTTDLQNAEFLVINGADTGWERQRSNSFKEQIKSKIPDAVILESNHINYERPIARTECYHLLKSQAIGNEIHVRGIFACNDDMAIGARTAVIELENDGYKFPFGLKIVGYDGIKEIKEYIELSDDYIVGTIDVNIEEQSKAAIGLMSSLIRYGSRKRDMVLIKPKPYTNISQ